MTVEQAIQDYDRVEYFRGMTAAIYGAKMEDGVDVRAYFPWSAWPSSLFLELCGKLILELYQVCWITLSGEYLDQRVRGVRDCARY